MTPIIEVDHASKRYRPRRSARILLGHGGLAELFRRDKESAEEVVALRDVSFTVEPGESVGLIGANGSGKSTMLKLLAGVAVPTSGHVTVRGRVASLLELGAGFHPMLTGRENVYLNAGLLGMRHAEVDKVFDEIVAFSGIGDAIDQPVDTYSSGMYVRLGFAVAAHVNPDIFLVDEVLSVGDEAFQRKCRTRIAELRDQGKTILFVSHDLSIVNLLCNRVVLLNHGEVVTRGTPRDTIDYYLRQIGQEKGIHTLKSEQAEAIVSHGRISVFLDQQEVSAPSGLQVEVRSLEQSHGSTMAEWEVIERSPSHCVTRGRMTKLPASYVWDVRLEGTQLTWNIAIDCERDVKLALLDANLFLPTAYTHWYYGANAGEFPAMTSGDLVWNSVLLPTATCRYVALLTSGRKDKALLAVNAEAHKPYFRLALLNTDYFMGCRVIQAGGRIPEDDQPLKAGLHSFMTLRFELAASRSAIEAHSEECIVRQGSYAAVFKEGQIHLMQNGQSLSGGPHIYSALLAGNLWNPSTSLQWMSIRREGGRLIARGESRRLPYTQEWELSPVENGFALTIWIEPRESLAIQEYQVSTCLVESYDHWETERESGEFPPMDPSVADWRHVNRDYAPGAWIRGFAETMPCVSMRVTAADIPFRMTAVNTSFQEHARVLQALRTPDHGMVNFAPGRQLYFTGIIEIASQGHSA